jgi:hypothetical protein
MPWMQVMVDRGNAMFSRRSINRVSLRKLEALGRDATFADHAVALKIAESKPEQQFLAGWPAGQLAAVSAAIRSCLRREPRMPITLAWAPGYEYEVTIWESAGIKGSEGGMTILFRSRYPGDEVGVTVPRRPAARAKPSNKK